MMGMPWSQLRHTMTSKEWAWYQAADAVGLIPDWVRQQQLMCVAAGIDPEQLFDDGQPQDMAEMYDRRKRLHGG